MLSRIFWIALAGFAMIAGLIYQGRTHIDFGHGSDKHRERVIDARVDRAVDDRIVDRMTVVDRDGQRLEVSRESKKELGRAVREVVAAKTQLAILRARNADAAKIGAAEHRDARARAEFERLQSLLHAERDLTHSERDRVRTQVREEVRQAIRESIRG